MEYKLKCEYCGKEFTRKHLYPENKHNFCCYQCSAKWRVENGHVPRGYTPENRGTLQYDDVKIRVTNELPLFPEYRPVLWKVYKAERYQGQSGSKLIGYVISVNGHRVNVRQNECVEV